MEQLEFNFKEQDDIPAAHFYAFNVCNSAGSNGWKNSFYALKNELLKAYGHEADYDLQYIEKKCYTCNGTGMYSEINRCRNCLGTGIYAKRNVLLKRFLLNGHIFHQPVGELIDCRGKIFDGYTEDDDCFYGAYAKFRYENFNGVIKENISGLIKHEPHSLNPTFAFYYLLWVFDREKFYSRMNGDLKVYQTNTLHRLRQLLAKYSPLKAYAMFHNVEQKDLEPIDDLPF